MDISKIPVGVYPETQNRSYLANQLEVSDQPNGRPLGNKPKAADGKKRLRGFAVAGLIKWLITALLLMGFVLTVHFYQGKVLSNNDKSIFDSIVVTLSLVVGLNIASALKDIAKHMRWWFLSLKRRDLSEVNEILYVIPVWISSGIDIEIHCRLNSSCIVTACSMLPS